MAFVAGVDVTTGDLITAAFINNYLGVAGSIDYLKTEADKHNDCVQRDGTSVAYASPAGVRAKNTIYENTSGKTRFVAISVVGAAQNDALELKVENATPPTITVGDWIATDNVHAGTITGVVPAGSYYKANEAVATITLGVWIEWDIL